MKQYSTAADILSSVGSQIAELLQPDNPNHVKAVEKGYLLYSQGMVRSIRRSGNRLNAEVQDVVPVHVLLDLQTVLLSNCSCPGSTLCRHELAVFFQLYGKENSVTQWIKDWKNSRGTGHASDNLKALKGVTTASDDWKDSKGTGPVSDEPNSSKGTGPASVDPNSSKGTGPTPVHPKSSSAATASGQEERDLARKTTFASVEEHTNVGRPTTSASIEEKANPGRTTTPPSMEEKTNPGRTTTPPSIEEKANPGRTTTPPSMEEKTNPGRTTTPPSMEEKTNPGRTTTPPSSWEGMRPQREKIRGIHVTKEEPKDVSAVMKVYRNWVDVVEETFSSHFGSKSVLPSWYFGYTGIAALDQLDVARPMNREFIPLYDLVTNVHFLYKLIELIQEIDEQEANFSRNFEQTVHTIHRQLEQAVQAFPKPAPFSFDAVFEKLIEVLRELLFLERPFGREIVSIYWIVWNAIFTGKNLRERELDFAERTAKKSNPDSLWHAALSIQRFLAGDVEKALHGLEKGSIDHFHLVLRFLRLFQSQSNWKGYDVATPFLLKHLSRYTRTLSFWGKNDLVEQIQHLYSDYALQRHRNDTFEAVLFELLPYSGRQLAQYYFSRKNYRKLIDLLQIAGLGLNGLSQEMVKEIQREDPECLLPLYHRAVDGAIRLKNRQSYKEAVRHLKKLRTIYKKLKEEGRWNQYFTSLLEETKRLRAFQEECRRGKLIDDKNETA